MFSIHLFNKYVLSTYYVQTPCYELGAGDEQDRYFSHLP